MCYKMTNMVDNGLPVQYWNAAIPISATPALVTIVMATGSLYFFQPAVVSVVVFSCFCLANCRRECKTLAAKYEMWPQEVVTYTHVHILCSK